MGVLTVGLTAEGRPYWQGAACLPLKGKCTMLPPLETRSEKAFDTTNWSVVLAAGDRTSVQGHSALAQLCQTYWLPVYAFIRKRGHPPDCAKDLTQDFFESFLQKNSVARAMRERGRFRSFLLTSVENFLRNVHERCRALKRGGGRSLVSLDDVDAEACYLSESADESDPARDFELRWALTILQKVMHQLREEYFESGRGELFDALQAHFWGDADSTSYPEIANQCRLTVANVKITAHRLRHSYRALLRQEIAQTVALPGEIDEEIRYLMRIVSR
jgi:RNA polymerase sigma-70 factor (ECF subfamily)